VHELVIKIEYNNVHGERIKMIIVTFVITALLFYVPAFCVNFLNCLALSIKALRSFETSVIFYLNDTASHLRRLESSAMLL